MFFRRTVELFKLCNTPVSIISPFPLFAVTLFLLSRKEFLIHNANILLYGIVITLISNFGSNLWNHCNDLKEDIAQGKKTILTQHASMQTTACIIAILLYVCSMLFVYYLSLELKRPIYLYFSIWAVATWWYSDNLILKKLTGFRLKDHYIGELITYSVAWPMYTLSIWLIYSDLNLIGLTMVMAFFFFGLFVLLLKDLKDISGDRTAGLRTFGVVFSPSQLIKYSCYIIVLYYLVILNPFTLNLFNNGILVIVLPFIYFLRNTFFYMYKKQWILNIGDLKALKGMGISIYMSVILMGLSSFL